MLDSPHICCKFLPNFFRKSTADVLANQRRPCSLVWYSPRRVQEIKMAAPMDTRKMSFCGKFKFQICGRFKVSKVIIYFYYACLV